MKLLKSFSGGLLVSFIGSVPMGYLNLLAYEMLRTQGFAAMSFFVTGIVTVEFVIILATLHAAQWLLSRPKLVFGMELFTIAFLLFLSVASFFAGDAGTGQEVRHEAAGRFTLFLRGMGFSALNLLQIVFWTGWNVYMADNGYVEAKRSSRFTYAIGAVTGTFGAMVVFSLVMQLAVSGGSALVPGFAAYVVPVLLFALAVFQGVKTYRKRIAVKSIKH